MKHRDRVLMARSHREPDRCPRYVSSTPEFASRRKMQMGLEEEDPHQSDGGGSTYLLDRALNQHILYAPVGFGKSFSKPKYARRV